MPISIRNKKSEKIARVILGTPQNAIKKRKKTKKEASLCFEESRKV